MKKLIICEKPSLARNVKDAISRVENVKYLGNKNMYYFESNSYIITFCFGHLFGLGEPEKYVAEGETATLPIIPEHFKLFANDSDCARQYGLIKKLLEMSEIDGVIHCGDADQEGEIIVRNVLRVAKNTKPVYRLWLPEQTESSILKALNTLQSDSKYDDLANAGYARTFVDWLFGYNLSRYLMQQAGVRKGWGVGRVMIPIVDTVYQRELEIRNFVSSPYFQLHGEIEKDGIKVTITDKEKYEQQTDARLRLNELSAGSFTVGNIESKQAVVTPPKMFSLDTLQGKLSKDLGMTLDQSKKLIQSIYEKKFITYPRSKSEYFAEEEKNDVYAVVDKLNEVYSLDLEHKDNKRIFDSSKVESHSAIRPTTNIPADNDLSDDEKKVYDVIVKRFCAVFAPPCTVNRTVITFTDGTHEFKIKGDTPITDGFRKYEPQKKDDNEAEGNSELPSFSHGESVNITWVIDNKMTKAPPRYTIDSLNAYLKAPFAHRPTSDEDENDDELYQAVKSGMEIGTVATRTEIITKVVKTYKYLDIKQGKYYCNEKGEAFINYLHQLNIDLFTQRNVEFNMMIKSVELGKTTMQAAIDRTSEEIRSIIAQNISISSAAQYEQSNSIGKCPFCGSEIIDGKKNYYCAGYKTGCKFSMFKTSYCKLSFVKDGQIINYSKPFSITKANAKALLNSGSTTVSIEEKNGNGKYKVSVTFDKSNNKHQFLGERIREKKKDN